MIPVKFHPGNVRLKLKPLSLTGSLRDLRLMFRVKSECTDQSLYDCDFVSYRRSFIVDCCQGVFFTDMHSTGRCERRFNGSGFFLILSAYLPSCICRVLKNPNPNSSFLVVLYCVDNKVYAINCRNCDCFIKWSDLFSLSI